MPTDPGVNVSGMLLVPCPDEPRPEDDPVEGSPLADHWALEHHTVARSAPMMLA